MGLFSLWDLWELGLQGWICGVEDVGNGAAVPDRFGLRDAELGLRGRGCSPCGDCGIRAAGMGL